MHRLRSFAGKAAGTLLRPVRAAGRRLRPLARPLRPVGRAARAVLRTLRRPARALFALLAGLAGMVPALIAGAGVFLVVAGLFNYFQPSIPIGPSPSEVVPSGSAGLYTMEPLQSGSSGTPGPSGSPTWAAATRVTIPALGIDDPIIPQPAHEVYPLCDTAEYLVLDKAYGFPGAPQATYLFAHARVGMFWNLLVQSTINNGQAMIGMWVEVYTDDNQRHIYEITQVIRHVPPNAAFADKALTATTDQLWLQTSEGHLNSSTKLQVVAMPIGVIAASYEDAHPPNTAKICPDRDLPYCTAPDQSGCRRR
jgi:hypothetical protein